MNKTTLRKYANLIVRCGVNVQKGQTVLIYADLDQPEFVQMVVDEAYKAKAAEVIVQWTYQPLEKLHYRYRTVKSLGTVKEWEKARQEYYCQVLPARIHLISEDPDGMKGINMEKMTKARRMAYPILKPFHDRRENREQWCIAAVPGAAWARKVFPGVRTSTAIEKLWEAILFTSRVNEDPVEAWKQHNADLSARCRYLNDLHIRSLHYTAENGTDFTVTFAQAALGDTLYIPTLDGKVKYELPAGTQPGTVFRLKNKGIKSVRGNRKGDLYVRVTLEVPTKLNSKQKKAIEAMGKAVGSECYQKKSSFLDSIKEFFS